MLWFDRIFETFGSRVVFDVVEPKGRSRMKFEIFTSMFFSYSKKTPWKFKAVLCWTNSYRDINCFSSLFFLQSIKLCVGQKLIQIHLPDMCNRIRPRFFDQVGHETMYASSGNKNFFTKSCHRQTYQNYEWPPWTSQNLYFQSHFSVLRFGQIFPKKKILWRILD